MDVRQKAWFRISGYPLLAIVGVILVLCSWVDGGWATAVLPVAQQAPQKPLTEGPESGVSGLSSLPVSPVQEPEASLPQNLTVPSVEGVLPPLPSSPDIEAIIRKSLSNPEAGASTGDPILDGVLEAAGRRGSVVKGSMLERFPSADLNANTGLPTETPSSPRGIADHRFPQSREQAEDELCNVAEQLLVTARLLARLPDGGMGHRRRLVAEMRREAARLLGTLEPGRGEYVPESRSEFQDLPLRHPGEEHPSEKHSGEEHPSELADPFSR